MADASLGVVDDDYPAAVPAKIYEAWALRKPVLLLAHRGKARDLVLSQDLRWVAPPDDPQQIELCILQTLHQFQDSRLLRPITRGLEKYDRKHLTSTLAAILDSSITSSC